MLSVRLGISSSLFLAGWGDLLIHLEVFRLATLLSTSSAVVVLLRKPTSVSPHLFFSKVKTHGGRRVLQRALAVRFSRLRLAPNIGSW